MFSSWTKPMYITYPSLFPHQYIRDSIVPGKIRWDDSVSAHWLEYHNRADTGVL